MKKSQYTYHSPSFLKFWEASNKKGDKRKSEDAFFNRLQTHTEEDIRNAYKQLEMDKKNQAHEFWPMISTFLNSGFDSYFDRSQARTKPVSNLKYPTHINEAAARLGKNPKQIPFRGQSLSEEDRDRLNIPMRCDSKAMLRDIKVMIAGNMTIDQYYDKWQVPFDQRMPEHREAAF